MRVISDAMEHKHQVKVKGGVTLLASGGAKELSLGARHRGYKLVHVKWFAQKF